MLWGMYVQVKTKFLNKLTHHRLKINPKLLKTVNVLNQKQPSI